MRRDLCVIGGAAMFALVIRFSMPTVHAEARSHIVKMVKQTPEEASSGGEKLALKPEIAALIKKSTGVYSVMKSYRHNSEYFSKTADSDGEARKTIVFTLALERPNKFCYKADTPDLSAAICDGKTFINHRIDTMPSEREHTYYTKTTAPSTYKGINIVDDVSFTYGTYLIALMLQGDMLVDKDVNSQLEKATLRAGIEENGKKYDVLNVPFPGHVAPFFKEHNVQFYFDASTHLLHKAIEDVPTEESGNQMPYKVLEIIENVLIDKPLPVGTFEYKIPKNARQVVGLPDRISHTIADARFFAAERFLGAGKPNTWDRRVRISIDPAF